MLAAVRCLVLTWSCFLVHHSLCSAINNNGRQNDIARYPLRKLLSDGDTLTKADDEEPEKINLIIVPLMAFAAFMIFLCMRCCHWNQKDFRDRGIIIEHHHTRKKHIAQGLMHTRFDGQSQRRLSCVPEQLMLLPLFLTGSAREELNKMVDPPQDGIVEKTCESDCESEDHHRCDSEPPSTDSEFDTPFPYQSPGRRRSSSVPPDILLTKGRFKKSRSSSIVDMRSRWRRMSVASAISSKSTPHTLNTTNQVNHNPNLLSVTAELHEPPRTLSQEIIHSGDVTPESIIFPLPGDSPRFSSEIRITRDVSVETRLREVGVDTSDLYPWDTDTIRYTPTLPLTELNRGLYVIQHRKFARVRQAKRQSPAPPLGRKRRRCDDDQDDNVDTCAHTSDYKTQDAVNLILPRIHTGPNDSSRTPDNSHSTIEHDDDVEIKNLNCSDIKSFIDFNPFEAAVTNGLSPNSSGHSFSNDSDQVSVHMPPLSLSSISSNSEFYRRLCSSEDSALAKSPISELSGDDRSQRDPLSRDGTLSPPPPVTHRHLLNGRPPLLHSKPNMQTVNDDITDDVMDGTTYSQSPMTSSRCGYRPVSTSERQYLSVPARQDEGSVTEPLLP